LWKRDGAGFAALHPACFNIPEALQQERAGNGAALRWQVAILKILASRSNGEAPVSAIARELSILISARTAVAASPAGLPDHRSLFAGGLVERPGKGRWRISDAGRDYLKSLDGKPDHRSVR
jgi:hypothetical protein